MHWSQKEILENKESIKKVFFYFICGKGMGAAAILISELGLEVSGTDTNFNPPMGDFLKNSNINLIEKDLITHEYLKEYDLICVGNVVSRGSKDYEL